MEGKKKERIVVEPEVKAESGEERLKRKQETVGPFERPQ